MCLRMLEKFTMLKAEIESERHFRKESKQTVIQYTICLTAILLFAFTWGLEHC